LSARALPVAVRIPHALQTDVVALPFRTPQLFIHEGARQSLQRRLAHAHHRPVVLAVTDNCRNMISHSSQDGVLTARIHHMFLDAPARVQDALVQYMVRGDRSASNLVGRFIDENGHRIRASRPVLQPLTTQGEVHDLLPIFRRLNDTYFDGAVDALLTWGRAGRKVDKKARRSIKLGSYSAVERLIRVHPVLDKPWVPRYFVSFILFHEMLHHVIPSSQGKGRRMLHPPAFRERERAYRDYERASAWEKAHIGRLLRA
jgi:hypothetical protein